MHSIKYFFSLFRSVCCLDDKKQVYSFEILNICFSFCIINFSYNCVLEPETSCDLFQTRFFSSFIYLFSLLSNRSDVDEEKNKNTSRCNQCAVFLFFSYRRTTILAFVFIRFMCSDACRQTATADIYLKKNGEEHEIHVQIDSFDK